MFLALLRRKSAPNSVRVSKLGENVKKKCGETVYWRRKMRRKNLRRRSNGSSEMECLLNGRQFVRLVTGHCHLDDVVSNDRWTKA